LNGTLVIMKNPLSFNELQATMQWFSLFLFGLVFVSDFAEGSDGEMEMANHRALADPTIPSTATIVFRINCGGKAGFLDVNGNLWSQDIYFDGGGRFVTPLVGIRSTTIDKLYRSSRYEFKVRPAKGCCF